MNTLSYKTISANAKTAHKEWVVVDVKDLPLGRVATVIANFLRGKYKTNYTPHVDCGDNVIVVNASTVTLSGKKMGAKGIHPSHRLSWRTTYFECYTAS